MIRRWQETLKHIYLIDMLRFMPLCYKFTNEQDQSKDRLNPFPEIKIHIILLIYF